MLSVNVALNKYFKLFRKHLVGRRGAPEVELLTMPRALRRCVCVCVWGGGGGGRGRPRALASDVCCK